MSFNFFDFLIRFVLQAVWVFLAVMALGVAFSGRSIFVRRRRINPRARTEFFSRNKMVLLRRCRSLDFATWVEAIVLALITGVANYVSFISYQAAPWLLLAMIGVVVYTCVLWHKKCDKPGQLLPLAVLLIPIMAAVFNTAEQSVLNTWISMFWVSVLHCTFWIILVLALAFYSVSLLFYYYDYKARDYEDAQKYRGSAWAVKIVALIVVALIAWQCFAWSTINWSFSKPAAAQNTEQQTTTSSTSVNVDEEVKVAVNNLTVTEVTPAELEKLTVKKYAKISQVLLQSSLTTHDRKRTKSTGFSDALTYGFKNKKSTSKMFKELEEEILRNPVYGVTIANALKNKKVGNKTIGSFNPWMGKMVSVNRKKGVSHWLEHRGESKTIYVTDEYRRYAATLCTFLERLIDQGVQTNKTYENWCLNATSKNNKRAGIKASYQYSKKALILAYVAKNKVPFLIVGFNIHDKRPEFYSKKHQPKIVKTPSGTTGGGGTSSNPTPGNTPTTPNSTTPSTPTPGNGKNPADDPVNKGNADKGGGQNRPNDGSGQYQPNDPRNEDPGTSKTPEKPKVDPGHSGEDVVDHDNPMNYETDPVTDRGPINQSPPTNSDGDGEFTPND